MKSYQLLLNLINSSTSKSLTNFSTYLNSLSPLNFKWLPLHKALVDSASMAISVLRTVKKQCNTVYEQVLVLHFLIK